MPIPTMYCVDSCFSPTCSGNCTKNATSTCGVCTHLDGIYHFNIDCITLLLTLYPDAGCTVPTTTSSTTTLISIPNATCSPGYTTEVDHIPTEHFVFFDVCPCTEYCWQRWFIGTATSSTTNTQCTTIPDLTGNFCCGACITPDEIFAPISFPLSNVGSFIVDCQTQTFIPYTDTMCTVTLSSTLIAPFELGQCFPVTGAESTQYETWKILECATGPSDACFREYETNKCTNAIYQQSVNFDVCQIITPIVTNAFGANLTASSITTYLNTDCTTVTNAPGYDICIDFFMGGSGKFTLGECSDPDPPTDTICIAQFLVFTSTAPSSFTTTTSGSSSTITSFDGVGCNASRLHSKIVLALGNCTQLTPGIWGYPLLQSTGGAFILDVFSDSDCSISLGAIPVSDFNACEQLTIDGFSYQVEWLPIGECETCTEYCMSSWHPDGDLFGGIVRNSDCRDAPTATVTYCCGRCYTECELWNVSCTDWASWTGHKGLMTDCSTHITRFYNDEFCQHPHQPTTTVTDVYDSPVGECTSIGSISSFRADYDACPPCPHQYCMLGYGHFSGTTQPSDTVCEGPPAKALTTCCDECYDICELYGTTDCRSSTVPVTFQTDCNSTLTTFYESFVCGVDTSSVPTFTLPLEECTQILGPISLRMEDGKCPPPVCQPYCLNVWSPNNVPEFTTPGSTLNGNCSGEPMTINNYCCGLCYDACSLFGIITPACEFQAFSFQIDCISQVSTLYSGRSCSIPITSHESSLFGYVNASLGQCADYFGAASWRTTQGICGEVCFREYSDTFCSTGIYTQDIFTGGCQVITPISAAAFGASLTNVSIAAYLNTDCTVLTGAPGYDICFPFFDGGSGKFTHGNCSIPDIPTDTVCLSQFIVRESSTTFETTFPGPLCSSNHSRGNLAVPTFVCIQLLPGLWGVVEEFTGEIGIVLFADANCTNELTGVGPTTLGGPCVYSDFFPGPSFTTTNAISYQVQWLPIESCEVCVPYCLSGWFPNSEVWTGPIHNTECRDAPTETTTFCCDKCYRLCDLFNLTCAGDLEFTFIQTSCSTHETKWYLDDVCMVPFNPGSSGPPTTFFTPVGECQAIDDTSSFMVNYDACPPCPQYCISSYGFTPSADDPFCENAPTNLRTTCCGQCYDLCTVLGTDCPPSSSLPFSIRIACNSSETTIYEDANCSQPITASSSAYQNIPLDQCIPFFPETSLRTNLGRCPTVCTPYCLDSWSTRNLFSSWFLPSSFNPDCAGPETTVTNVCCGECYDACVLLGIECPGDTIAFGGLSFRVDCATEISTLYYGKTCELSMPGNQSFVNSSLGECVDFSGHASWKVLPDVCPPPYCYEIWGGENFTFTPTTETNPNGDCLGVPRDRLTLYCDRCYDACALFDTECTAFVTEFGGLSLKIDCASQNTTLYVGGSCNITFPFSSSQDHPGANISLGQCDGYFSQASWRTSADACQPLQPSEFCYTTCETLTTHGGCASCSPIQTTIPCDYCLPDPSFDFSILAPCLDTSFPQVVNFYTNTNCTGPPTGTYTEFPQCINEGGQKLNIFLCPSPPTPTPCINLGNATPFGVLGASTVTNTGSSVVTGDLGLYPGTSVTGICTSGPGTVIGTCDITNSIALDAQNDLTGAIINYNSLPCNFGPFGVTDLGGATLTTGVYCYSSSVGLTGTLTLNALGDPNALFVFKIGSSLTTASSSQVIMINGGAICNIYWVVGSSATLGTGSSFLGNILAVASVTLTTGASLSGRALAQNGAVTLDTNAVTICETCNTSAPSPTPCINSVSFRLRVQ
jgi:hypothetical protein